MTKAQSGNSEPMSQPPVLDICGTTPEDGQKVITHDDTRALCRVAAGRAD
jgi:hypothetical protein